jgi:spermidine/putrescine transport system permease protein
MTMRTRVAGLPYVAWMVIFIVLPMALVFYYAFTGPDGRFTLDNMLDIGQYGGVFARSIWLALIATAICLLLAFPLAYIISRLSGAGQSLAIMLIMLPMWINFLLRTYAWVTLLENENGIINSLLGLVGLGPLKLINTPGAVVLGMVYNYLPFMILPLYSVMVKIDQSLIDAAQDLGAGMWRVTARVILPLSVPGIMTGITMVFVPSISTFVISQKLGGGANQLIGDLIELQFGQGNNFHLGSALSLVLMVVVLLCMGLANQFDDEQMEGMLL